MPLNQVADARDRVAINDRRRRNTEKYVRRRSKQDDKRQKALEEALRRAARGARRDAKDEGLRRGERREAVKDAKREVRQDFRSADKNRAKAAERARYRTRTNQGVKVRFDEDGYISAKTVENRGLKAQSASKLNSALDEGYYLTPGKRRVVVGTKNVRFLEDDGTVSRGTTNLYKRLADIRGRRRRDGDGRQRDGDGRQRGGGKSSGGGSSGGMSTSASSGGQEPRPPSFYEEGSGSAPSSNITPPGAPVNPNFSPTGAPYGTPTPAGITPIYWDSTPEAINRYTDRLDSYNSDNLSWMDSQARANQYEAGQYLRNFASALPPAPDPSAANDEVLDFLKRAGRVLDFA